MFAFDALILFSFQNVRIRLLSDSHHFQRNILKDVGSIAIQVLEATDLRRPLYKSIPSLPKLNISLNVFRSTTVSTVTSVLDFDLNHDASHPKFGATVLLNTSEASMLLNISDPIISFDLIYSYDPAATIKEISYATLSFPVIPKYFDGEARWFPFKQTPMYKK